MPVTDLKKDDDIFYHSYVDMDIDDEDEFPGGSKINGCMDNVHAPDVEAECFGWDEEINFGVTKEQNLVHDTKVAVTDLAYLVDQDGDNDLWLDHLEEMRRWM